MTGEAEDAPARLVPQFISEWREQFGESAQILGPLDYLNQEQGLKSTIAAQWLFCPDFTEYRGCVVVIKNSHGQSGLGDRQRAGIDAWYEHFNGDVRSVEGKANLLIVPGLFASVELTGYEDDLPGLAHSVARCWEGLLILRYPDRRFTVEVQDDPTSETDPQITFYTDSPQSHVIGR